MIKVFDNFLSEDDFLKIKSQIISFSFPWHVTSVIEDGANDDKLSCDEDHNMQLVHIFYSDLCPQSDLISFLYPLIEVIKPKSLISIKANFNFKTTNIIEHGFHNDWSFSKETKHKTGIYYLNTNNGYTKFLDGDIIDTIENRFVEFDSDMDHTGTTCTNSKSRVVINFNYFK
tara:strand:- start:662 stop:1180 length:519 start_codon:yes stop_codon:yes gene_type:complete